MSKVMASVDGSRSSPSVCDHAVWAAHRLQAPLTFLHAFRNPHGERERDLSGNLTFGARESLLDEMVELEEQRGKLARERLLAPRQQLEGAGYTVHAEVRPGGIDETVCTYRKEQDIHLMAMGAYGHSRLRRFFVGSTTTHMIMHSSTPLLILR
ncbi:MAG: universal stress protein [Halorhodospira sp.]